MGQSLARGSSDLRALPLVPLLLFSSLAFRVLVGFGQQDLSGFGGVVANGDAVWTP